MAPATTPTRLGVFTRAVLEAAGIPCEDYHTHPARMDKLFRLAIPDGLETQQYVEQLRLEIQKLIS
jgi:hypothetical protein